MSRKGWLVGLLALLLLSGCGGGGESPIAETDKAQVARTLAETLQTLETQRQALYESLEGTVEPEALAAVRCNTPDTVEGLSRSVRREIIEYCENAEDLVRNANFTVSQFNETLDRLDPESETWDEEFQELFNNEWLRLQGQV
ncbi:DUF4168 domain-containing protein [Geitlerinema sp. CS-897]|nr:DUF4168 domain-containing protein [Geitlerinema sp. CS-897]